MDDPTSILPAADFHGDGAGEADDGGKAFRLTVLRATFTRRAERPILTKRWRFDAGKMIETAYDKAAIFTTREVEARTPAELLAVLRQVAKDPHSCIVRAQRAPRATDKHIRRLLRGDDATMVTVARAWAAFDFDSVVLPFDLVGDGVGAIGKALLELLPEPFHGCTCVLQLTSGAMIKPGVRARLWVCLSRPVTGAELIAWLHTSPVDPSTLREIEPIYTAAPLFEGMADPCEHLGRLHLIEGHADVVELPDVLPDTRPAVVRYSEATGESIGADGWLLLMGDGPELSGFYWPIVSAVASHFGRYGAAGGQERAADLKEDIRAAIEAAPKAGHRGADLERYAGDPWLDELVTSFARKQTAKESDPVRLANIELGRQMSARIADQTERRRIEALPASFLAAVPERDNEPDHFDPELSPELAAFWRERELEELENGNGGVLALAEPAGSGKTRSALASVPCGGTNLVLMPTTALAIEAMDILDGEGLPALHFRGRLVPGYCEYPKVAEAITAAGLSVRRTKCNEPCDAFTACKYEAQPKEMGEKTTVGAHEYAVLVMRPGDDEDSEVEAKENDELWPKSFNTIIIDEKILSKFCDRSFIRLKNIPPPQKTPDGVSVDQYSWFHSTCARVRDWLACEIYEDELTKKQVFNALEFQKYLITKLLPESGEPDDKILRKVAELRDGHHFRRRDLLEIINEGFELGLDNQCFVVAGDIVHMFKRKEMEQKSKNLILCDADLDSRLAGLIFGFDTTEDCFRVVSYRAKRNAFVTQAVGGYSRRSLLGWYRVGSKVRVESDFDVATRNRERLERVIAGICRDGKPTLVVGIRDLISPDPKRGPVPEGYQPLRLPPRAEGAWFGGILGIDRWKHHARVIAIGAPNVPAMEVEALARCLAGNDPRWGLTLPGNFTREEVTLRDRAGRTMQGRRTMHPDELVRIIGDQLEVAEVMQAIDRLRLIHRQTPAEVFYFGPLQLRCEVDRLIDAGELIEPTNEERVLGKFGVLPLSRAELASVLGVTPKAIKNARNRARRAAERGPQDAIEYRKRGVPYKADVAPFPAAEAALALGYTVPVCELSPWRTAGLALASYRLTDQSDRGSSHKALVEVPANEAEAMARLEAMFGAGTIRKLELHGDHRGGSVRAGICKPASAATTGSAARCGNVMAGARASGRAA